jgi:uncharacterized protein
MIKPFVDSKLSFRWFFCILLKKYTANAAFVLCVVLWASGELQAQSVFSKIKGFLPNIPPEAQLITAVQTDNVMLVEALLKAGLTPAVTQPSPPQYSLLHLAAWENAEKSLSVLLKHPQVQVDVLSALGETPLMIAALKGYLGVAQQLLKAGAYPNKTGWTPLHYAASAGNVEMMQLLLDAHAYIDAESPNKTTPLMMAARSKEIGVVKFLLDEGADMTLKNEQGFSAIDFAEKAGAQDIAQGLRERARKIAERQAKPAWLR